MPSKPRKPCNHPGCRRLVDKGYCADHERKHWQEYDRWRGSSAERGYGHRWRKYREWFLKQNPLCVRCKETGKLEPATVVDHVIPVTGADDPLFWDTDNHQALCDRCHNIKRATEDKETWARRKRG